MNKGLELIEAYHLFPVGAAAARRASCIPSRSCTALSAITDGSVMAQLACPDMRTPIALALSWPRAHAHADGATRSRARLAASTFEAPDEVRFPALRVAREALQRGGSAPAVLNAANEVAVEAFLTRRIGFLDIARIVGGLRRSGTCTRPHGAGRQAWATY